MLSEQDDLAGRLGCWLRNFDLRRFEFAEYLLCLPALDLSTRDQAIDELIIVVLGRANSRGHAARVQPHMPLLNTAAGKRPQRGEVLRQSNGRHQFGQLERRMNPCDCKTQGRRRICIKRAADGAHLERNCNPAEQIAALVVAPHGKRPIAPPGRRERMRTGFDSAPVVARRDGKRVDAVHDALVVCCRAMRVRHRDVACRHDSIANRCGVISAAGEISFGESYLRCDDRAIGQVGEDTQRNITATQVGDFRSDRFADRVYEVRSHRVDRIDEQVHGDERPPVGKLETTKLYVPGAPAACHEPRMHAIYGVKQRRLFGLQRRECLVDIGDVADVDLPRKQ